MATTDSSSSKPFRVIVVGAGVVGLTFAHALRLANIEHVVLEKHDKIVSLKGAALVIWPQVARIFDQFGFMHKIHETTTPLIREFRRWPDGSVHSAGSTSTQIAALFGLPSVLTDRQTLVRHLYDNLADKSTVRTSSRVSQIEHTENGVRVHLADGSVEEGDMVIGADGVHSVVKEQIWKYAEKHEPGTIPESDKNAIFTNFAGLFGVSDAKDSFGLSASETNVQYGIGHTQLVFTQPGVVYWAIVFKDEFSQPPKKRNATEADMQAMAKRFADLPLTETLTFADIWETRSRYGLLNIEEGVLEKWHSGRLVLCGDSAHKMTADLGLGANIAIESAVSLANILQRELKSNLNRHPSKSELAAMFAEYQKDRFVRSKAFVEISGKATRMHTYQTYFGRFFVSYIAPLMVTVQVKKLAEALAKAPKLNYAPVHHINENAEGWQLGKKAEKKSSVGWITYALLTSTIGVTIAYVVTTGRPALF